MTIYLLLHLSLVCTISSLFEPKLSFIWDVIIIFQYFGNCGANGELLDKILTQKLALFPQLLGGQRVQTLLKFYIYKMSINSISVSFVSTQPLKHSRNRSTLNTFEYRVYDKPHFCVVACLMEYLSRRSNCAEHKPNKPASPDSIRRCIKGLFTDAKICDFTPHICRKASTSKVMAINVNIEDTLTKAAGKMPTLSTDFTIATSYIGQMTQTSKKL